MSILAVLTAETAVGDSHAVSASRPATPATVIAHENRPPPSARQASVAQLRRLSAPVTVVLVLLAGAQSAYAACATVPEQTRAANASVILVAQALKGPTTGGRLLSPAKFRVLRYLKGTGPPIVHVNTAITRTGGSSFSATGEAISPQAGEVWKIYALRNFDDTLQTSACGGSELIGERPLPQASARTTQSTRNRSVRTGDLAMWIPIVAVGVIAVGALTLMLSIKPWKTRRPD